jgi:hypothetical protein
MALSQGTGRDSNPFIRAKASIMEKVGSGKVIRPGGKTAARKEESRRSSDPHPVVTFSGPTPNLRATASFRGVA